MQKSFMQITIAIECIIFATLVSCAVKKQWQGTYISVSYAKTMPKEDFEIKQYVIVAYNMLAANKYSHIVYHFDVFQDNKKVGALEVCDRSLEDTSFPFMADPEIKYFLVAGDEEAVRKQTTGLRSAYQVVHKAYKAIPDYEQVKEDVKEVINKM